jgi:hypothetical protein
MSLCCQIYLDKKEGSTVRKIYVVFGLLLVAILISLGASFWFDVKVVALFTTIIVLVQKAKSAAFLEWAIRVSIMKLPGRLITKLVLRTIGYDALINLIKQRFPALRDWWVQSWLKYWLEKLPRHWRSHRWFRLTITAIIVVAIAVSSASFGIIIVFLFGLDEIFEIFKRFVWPYLSEFAFIKALGRGVEVLKRTFVGRFIFAVHIWCEHYIAKRAERIRDEQMRLALKLFEETLTDQLKSNPKQPLRPRNHEHLLEPSIRAYRKGAKAKFPRRQESRPPPRPR